MKYLLTFCLFISVAFAASAQQDGLAYDQNPNYMQSKNHYMGVKDSLTSTMNTTEQNTYKAYDWYEAKMERKVERQRMRNERRYYNNMNYGYNNWNNGYNNWNYNGWNNGYYNNGFYNNGYNNWGGYRNNGWFNSFNNYRPSVGFRTRHWFFGF